jgi:RNA polymerase sigma factor (sigma-70 family)
MDLLAGQSVEFSDTVRGALMKRERGAEGPRLPEDEELELLGLLQEIATLKAHCEPFDLADFDARADLARVRREILEREQRAIEIIYGFLRRSLPNLMYRMFGPKVVSHREDATVRFTELLHNFLVKILEKHPEELWRVRTARQLRNWASVANANLMRDMLRRERRGHEILRVKLAPLLEARSRHFEKTADRPLDELVLARIEAWVGDSNEVVRQMGLVLRYRYLDGLPYSEIADMLGISEATVQNRRSDGIERLRALDGQIPDGTSSSQVCSSPPSDGWSAR